MIAKTAPSGRKDWLIRQFTKVNFGLAYAGYYIDQRHGHPDHVAAVTFRNPRDHNRFIWALLRLMICERLCRDDRNPWEGVYEFLSARRDRLKAEINSQLG